MKICSTHATRDKWKLEKTELRGFSIMNTAECKQPNTVLIKRHAGCRVQIAMYLRLAKVKLTARWRWRPIKSAPDRNVFQVENCVRTERNAECDEIR